ncbi:MAG TPA: bifunctional serine/threonine-protein kinase/formylglycine-generating enzyme family protein [Nodularia sp. (in: cyanobacteria)]|nr:bifunctional serine/threonine-protein kinase/formylglycine-generating enzyme family protein [Nodularia sp. (in: cyanobacteria)]
MSYCLNPNCQKPESSDSNEVCQNCGTKFLLGDRYRSAKLLGSGGFGRTFLAIDQLKPSKPFCVIKQFLPQGQGSNHYKAAELFQQEVIRLDELGHHPQIPELLAHYQQENHQYLVQEFISGQNLAEELKLQGAFNQSKIRQLLNNLLPVLQFIHGQNVIHRDIKPENIIRRLGKESADFVLVDFGAAKHTIHSDLSKTGTSIGSPEFVAPEQARGKALFNSDLYSLGVTCIHLLTQASPFDLIDMDHNWVWRDYLTGNTVSNDLGKILDKLIAIALSKRYQSADEVIRDLNPQNAIAISRNTITESPQSPVISTPKSIHEDLGDGIILEMTSIPAGEFIMGSPEHEESHEHTESPQHRVKIAPFFMGTFPITQAQFRAIMNASPSYMVGDDHPVECVSWNAVVDFCTLISQKTGRNYRLPSEAEWEYACRAGTKTSFHFGNAINTDLANYDGRYVYRAGARGEYRQTTTPVGTFSPNAFGLYDMHGNVWEWCQDIWHDDYIGAPTDGSAWERERSSICRVLRGGSWYGYPWYCRSAARGRGKQGDWKLYYGFRVALTL